MKRPYCPANPSQELFRDINMLEEGIARLCDRLSDGSDLPADERVGLAKTILALELQRQEKADAYMKLVVQRS